MDKDFSKCINIMDAGDIGYDAFKMVKRHKPHSPESSKNKILQNKIINGIHYY